jgi:hypothetical protein
MATVTRTKLVRKGDWRTLETGYNASFGCRFRAPAGAQVKLRKGVGWLGWDSQKKTLDGITDKMIQASGVYSRVQMKVVQDAPVTYVYIPV